MFYANFQYALVAQWIEQRFPVPRVGGSNPLGCIALPGSKNNKEVYIYG